MPIRTLVCLLICGLMAVNHSTADATPHVQLPDDALVVTHASRYYHTAVETEEATNDIVAEAISTGRKVFALGQSDVTTDSDWYTLRHAPNLVPLISRAGEHHLYPGHAAKTVTVIGGYHSACLGRTLSELAARFIEKSDGAVLEIRLPMRAIYTGFLFDSDRKLVPPTPRQESILDNSVDGLNLRTVTDAMTDSEWANFMYDSLRIAVFEKSPMRRLDLSGVAFSIRRHGKTMLLIPGRTGDAPAKVVIFDYLP